MIGDHVEVRPVKNRNTQPAGIENKHNSINLEVQRRKKRKRYVNAEAEDDAAANATTAIADKKTQRHVKTDAISPPASKEQKFNAARDTENAESVPKKFSKILTKFEKATKNAGPVPETAEGEIEDKPTRPLRDLVPIPRPKASSESRALPTFSALPQWLTEPVRVAAGLRTPFEDLGIEGVMLNHLHSKGLTQALAVQSAVIPLLDEKTSPHSICVSAATGSGKTLAYVLPIVQALRGRLVPKLRAAIVVPTRELVVQVREVLEICTSGTNLKVGTAVGSQTLRSEQETLVEREWRWDPEGYERSQERLGPVSLADFYLREMAQDPDIIDAVEALPQHVASYASRVDILVCTPGRLVDHIKSTRGFSLRDLDYLVIDEADRLLDDSFQEWSSVVNRALAEAEGFDSSNYRTGFSFSPLQFRKVRKIMLSATMTRDLSSLAALQLDAPKLVLVGDTVTDQENKARGSSSGFSVPPALEEFAVPVGDGSQKPLYLIQLLDKIFGNPLTLSHTPRLRAHGDADTSSDVSSSDTSSHVSSSDNASSTAESDDPSDLSSDPESDTESDSSKESSCDESDESSEGSQMSLDEQKRAVSACTPDEVLPGKRRVLIFTGSNVSALRLSRLVAHLAPEYARVTSTITKSSSKGEAKQIISGLRAGHISILIASDRVSRGLDISELSDVVNYDLPSSVASYVHRVGRTARAGRSGIAWTLIQHNQARWFWKEIGRSEYAIDRGKRPVSRIRLPRAGEWSDAVLKQYGEVLDTLRREVFQRRDGATTGNT